ncbi:MAG TPA: pitrilysin family protein [Gemmatimonadaceae bacterium]|nr:pitrilysin family protein [Gemmatimonadaceae bacterium]
MRRGLFVLASLVIAAAVDAQSPPIGNQIRNQKLANGLDVLVVENHAVPLVTVELVVKNGGFTETPDYNGLSHLYEHMFFKANRVIPSQEEYLRRTRQLGANWNGSTSEEVVNYYVTVGTDSVQPAMQFMEDAIRYPLFKQEELVRERPVVLGEFDRNEANPYFHLFRAMDTIVWTPAYYSRKNVIGNRDVIITATQQKMSTIQNRYYIPNNTALILAGDITPARGFALAQQVFGDWPRGSDPFPTPVPNPPPLTKNSAVIVEKPVSGASLALRWQGPSVTADAPATYAADLLSAVLSNHTSKFYKRMVDSGLTFDTNIGYYTLNHIGPITVFAQVAPEKVLDARRAILEELVKMADTSYITTAELNAAKSQLGINALYEREQSTQWSHTIGFWWSVAGLDYYRNYVPNMQRATKQDIARYIKQYIVGKPFVTGLLISPADRARLNFTPESLLAAGGF